MPLLTTFGSASARSFGRAIDLQPPVFPAGTVVMWNGSVSTELPANWSYLSGANGRMILGTATQSEINTSDGPAGSWNTTGSGLSSGNHSTPWSSFYYRASPSGNTSTYPGVYNQSNGAHTHTWTAQSFNADSFDMPAYEEMPFIYCSTEQTFLPAKSLVFRQSLPSSPNYQEYTPPRTTRFAWRCGQDYVSNQSVTRTRTLGTSGSGGTHNHGPSTSQRGDSFTYTVNQYDSTSQGHTHPQQITYSMRVTGKFLKTWRSLFQESLQNGMIVMYIGSLSNLPAGWRVCNGTLNTPDMRGYYLSSYTAVSTTHGYVTDTQTVLTLESASLTEVSWSHTHQGSSYTSNGRHSAYHSSKEHPHSHVASVGASQVTAYRPAAFRVAFIQYKGL